VADYASAGAVTGADADTGTSGVDLLPGAPHEHEAHHGRPASWVAVSIIIAGFIVGGIALPVGPTWWLFWLGVGIVVVGSIFAASVHIFDDWY
jgi:hypothetical protein